MGHLALIGDAKPDTAAVTRMRASSYNFEGTKWVAYQNHDLGHPDLGHLKFLAVGPLNTIHTAPDRLPDMERELNWRYVLVGYVDLESGEIVPI